MLGVSGFVTEKSFKTYMLTYKVHAFQKKNATNESNIFLELFLETFLVVSYRQYAC